MSLKKGLILMGVLVALGAVGYWGVSALLRGEPEVCQVCARPIHQTEAYTLMLADGTEEHACCPRCGTHFQLANPDRVRAAWATDYATGEKIDARRARYVEGSDLEICSATPPLQRARGSSYELVWDRCLPSLIAFKTAAAAERFQQQHGGHILTYAQMVESVKRQ